jgi:hypothetical protein
MDTFDKMHIAQTIRHLAEAYDKMGEALKGAQAAKQKKLFDIIYAKQWEIACLAADLIADMQPKPPEQVKQTECDDCGHKNNDLVTKSDHHGGSKTVCRDRGACNSR